MRTISATASQPTFALSDDNAVAVAEICRRLDGIPLALELAAARVRALPPEKLAERLDQRFRILTGGSRTALPRQRTLSATIDWSYDLLEPREQAVLQRLSVFVGGCTLEAAEAVCAGEPVEDWEVLDALTRLVAAGEVERWADAHLAYYAERAHKQKAWAKGKEQGIWIAVWAVEMGNVRAAPDHGRGAGRVEDVVRLVTGLNKYWWTQSAWSVVMDSFEWVIALGSDEVPILDLHLVLGMTVDAEVVRGRFDWAEHHARRRLALVGAQIGEHERIDGLNSLAKALKHKNELEEAAEVAGRARALVRTLIQDQGEDASDGDLQRLQIALQQSAMIEQRRLNLDAEERFLREDLEISRRLGQPGLVAGSLCNVAGMIVARGGPLGEARAQLVEARDLAEQAGFPHFLASILYTLGHCEFKDGRFDEARRYLEEALASFRQMGHREYESNTAEMLGLVDIADGAFDTAARHVRHCIAIRREIGGSVRVSLRRLADIAIGSGRSRDGLRLIGALFEHWPELEPDSGLMPNDDPSAYADDSFFHAAELERIRDTLGDAAVDAALADGRAMSIDEAVALAMTVEGAGGHAGEGGDLL